MDFVRNTMMYDTPAGYGTYQSQVDLLHEKEKLELEDQSNSNTLLGIKDTKKDLKYQIDARKIIKKYN